MPIIARHEALGLNRTTNARAIIVREKWDKPDVPYAHEHGEVNPTPAQVDAARIKTGEDVRGCASAVGCIQCDLLLHSHCIFQSSLMEKKKYSMK